ncbi:hypothetical protein ACGFIR_21635 [Micromonospora sp. NPDC049051]|uniref:hypothetical protein n=1 Tax=unclassified Micromonospora TaxID=2617518 RepID=UPI00371A0E78
MADIVVKDLAGLVRDLNELISQFEGALDFQNDYKGQWGQHNANLSMGDFAHNWVHRRDKMVKAMKEFRGKIEAAEENWADAERQLAESLRKKQP